MDRVGSYTSDSMKSDKTAKRRSGFFGLGKKDKEREKEDEVSGTSTVLMNEKKLRFRELGGGAGPRICWDPSN